MTLEYRTPWREERGDLPEGAAILTQSDIDGCCRGLRPAARDRSAPPRALRRYLETVRRGWDVGEAVAHAWTLSKGELVRFVVAECHRPFGAMLTNLETLISVIEVSHSDETETREMTRRIRHRFCELRSELLGHLMEEEDVLLPWIASDNAESAYGRIHDAMEQHKLIALKAKTMLAYTAWLTGQDSVCSGQRSLHAATAELGHLLAVHVNVENQALYSRALSKGL